MTAIAAPPARIREAASRDSALATVHFRLMVLMLLVSGVVLLIVAKLIWMGVAAGPQRANVVSGGFVPARADIVDRNGEPLARTIDGWSIAIHPREVISDRRELAQKLAALMPEHSAAWYWRALNSNRKFVYLRKRAMPELVRQVNALGEPAVALGREPERLYPQGMMAAHVLGFVDNDSIGRSGLELTNNGRLTDAAQRGEPLMLAMDSRVQAALESELNAAMVKHSAAAATGIVLDVHTGEVVALSSLPSYNPNVGPDANGVRSNELNMATQAVFELGSTFKPLTIANAIDQHVVTDIARRYDARAALRVGGYRIRDDHPANRWLNVPEMLTLSSNIVTAQIAEQIGAARMERYFRALGFYDKAAIELPNPRRPLTPHFWARTTVMTSGYGHGIAITPLHLANAYAALVNGGILRPATLLRRRAGQVPAGRRVIAPETSALMRRLLRLIVTDGTGRRADAAGMRVGGKTGTADKSSGGGYNRNARVSTFAAAFPMDDPKYVVVAMLDDPHGTADTGGFATAGMVAAPIVGKVVARIGPLLGVYPDEARDVDLSDLRGMIWKPKAER